MTHVQKQGQTVRLLFQGVKRQNYTIGTDTQEHTDTQTHTQRKGEEARAREEEAKLHKVHTDRQFRQTGSHRHTPFLLT